MVRGHRFQVSKYLSWTLIPPLTHTQAKNRGSGNRACDFCVSGGKKQKNPANNNIGCKMYFFSSKLAILHKTHFVCQNIQAYFNSTLDMFYQSNWLRHGQSLLLDKNVVKKFCEVTIIRWPFWGQMNISPDILDKVRQKNIFASMVSVHILRSPWLR